MSWRNNTQWTFSRNQKFKICVKMRSFHWKVYGEKKDGVQKVITLWKYHISDNCHGNKVLDITIIYRWYCIHRRHVGIYILKFNYLYPHRHLIKHCISFDEFNYYKEYTRCVRYTMLVNPRSSYRTEQKYPSKTIFYLFLLYSIFRIIFLNDSFVTVWNVYIHEFTKPAFIVCPGCHFSCSTKIKIYEIAPVSNSFR